MRGRDTIIEFGERLEAEVQHLIDELILEYHTDPITPEIRMAADRLMYKARCIQNDRNKGIPIHDPSILKYNEKGENR